MTNISLLVQKQRDYFKSGATLPLSFRKAQMKKLLNAIEQHETEIFQALKEDLSKSEFETFGSETNPVQHDLKLALKKIRRWTKARRVKGSMSFAPVKAFVSPRPLGNTLIISPWNYPFSLTLQPLVGAIAAGCTAIVKPSEFSESVTKILKTIIEECFQPEYIAVLDGGAEISAELLKHKFDLVFFTGSTRVGKIVMEAASKHLSPCVLELGGKNPCFVDETVNIKVAARRLVWGKFFNAGQTCIAPDYLLAEDSIHDELLFEMKKEIERVFGEDAKENDQYGRIIHIRQVKRLAGLLEGAEIFTGGNFDEETRYFEPTILVNVSREDKVMEDEIFGPILPVIRYTDLDAEICEVQNHDDPLSLYVFSRNKKNIDKILRSISSGGAGINDCIIHAAMDELPFGGKGASGMGSYHGKASFDAFTHFRSTVHKPFALDLKMRYMPYPKLDGLLKKLLKWMT